MRCCWMGSKRMSGNDESVPEMCFYQFWKKKISKMKTKFQTKESTSTHMERWWRACGFSGEKCPVALVSYILSIHVVIVYYTFIYLFIPFHLSVEIMRLKKRLFMRRFTSIDRWVLFFTTDHKQRFTWVEYKIRQAPVFERSAESVQR